MTLILNTLALALLGISTLAIAQPSRDGRPPHPPRECPPVAEVLKRMDTDGDRRFAEAEAWGPLRRDFKKLDTNKDGYLNEEEIEAGAKSRPSERSHPRAY